MIFGLLVTVFAGISAAIAAVAGFGIGSILTPLLSLEFELKIAVALVSIPHFVATAARFWRLRRQVDRHVLISFGITSAVGGLVGACLNNRFTSPLLTVIFGCLLVFAGFMGVSGLMRHLRFGKRSAWVAGFLSGGFGGLVGNQGGIRAAAMLTFDLSPGAFVATSTAIGLLVDLARMPVYFAAEAPAIFSQWRLLSLATLGVTVGTLIGIFVLAQVPKELFQRVVSALILVLGLVMLARGILA